MKVYIGPYTDNEEDREISIEIDNYDTWNMDSTLALIIAPMLKQLQATKHGSPNVDDEDVPENLRTTSAHAKEHEWDTDSNWHKRWDWVMDEMIWAFEQLLSDWEDQFYSYKNKEEAGFIVDNDGLEKHAERMENGFRLFGKYYTGLWD